ncbi:MAG: 16S rRNA (cytidine(1402)-2'-O)-methyltransferase [Candidatus Dojkabacteria bacterium]|nr:MAG: 16S rRNA (cytidine(1402)-2'-O)-methyltransferase [Candidatus Dojkabacteria bacterium]
MTQGKLYVIGTPIGNLKDLTHRAVEIFQECEYIVSENPSTSGKLLAAYGIKRPLRWYRESNHVSMAKIILDDILLRHQTVGLLSEAGTPGVSDPGAKLLQLAYQKNIPVIPIPGASAVTTAVSAFPLAGTKFLFWGFAPRKEGEFRRMITDNLPLLVKEKMALVYFESPFRLKKTLGYLSTLAQELSEQQLDLVVGLGKEMTKLYEQYHFASPNELLSRESHDFKLDKGESTLVIVIKKRHNESNAQLESD